MTPTEINVAVAECLGWRLSPDVPQDLKYIAVMCWIQPGNEDWQPSRLPDFYHSLDACAMMEATLKTDDEQGEYIQQIKAVTGAETPMPDWSLDCWAITTANAPQRCQAFLMLKNKWLETTK